MHQLIDTRARFSWSAVVGSLCVAAIFTGCPAPEPLPAIDGGEALDAPGTDTPEVDAPTPDPLDGAVSPDGGTAGDADGDGVPTATDCDDDDASVGTSSTRSCTSSCGVGVESCASGVWGACDAPTDCTCTSVGMTRVVPCGMCGTASQRCGSDLRWEMPSSCFSEGECFAGTVEQDTTMCGLSERLCDGSCMWLPWEVRTPPGECLPDASESTSLGCPVGQAGTRTCTAACTWGATTGCASACARPPAASRTGIEVRCVPAGPFLLGDDARTTAAPRVTVTLSDFYMSRYLVTAGAYRACMADGGCRAPPDPAAFAMLADGVHTMGVEYLGARDFCRWDGGDLPTELQWEKAARGPLPDARDYPWGAHVVDCEIHPGPGCATIPFAVDAFPRSGSPYGIETLTSVTEWTRNGYRAGWAWLDTSMVDPPLPSGGGTTPYSVRGGMYDVDGNPFMGRTLSYRTSLLTGTTRGFHCVY